MDWSNFGQRLVETAGFAAIGVAVFGVAFFLMVKVAPFSVRKEIEQDQNTALAVLMAAVIVGLALIVSAAVHG